MNTTQMHELIKAISSTISPLVLSYGGREAYYKLVEFPIMLEIFKFNGDIVRFVYDLQSRYVVKLQIVYSDYHIETSLKKWKGADFKIVVNE